MTAAVAERPAPAGRNGTRSRNRIAAPRTEVRRSTAPDLRMLDQVAIRARARRRNALLILFIAVIVGFFVVAFVHAELVAGQQELDAVRAEISQAEARHAEMARAVEEASAPHVIVTRATELGMVRANEPVYLVAAAPVRKVEVAPLLASTTDTVSPEPVSMVAAPVPVDEDGDGVADDVTGTEGSSIRATIGVRAGVSAEGRLAETPVLALEVPAPGPSRATSQTGTGGLAGASSAVAGSPLAGGSAPGATVAGGRPGRSATSIAGTRAVSEGTGGG